MSRFVSYLVQTGPLRVTAGEIVARMRSLYPQATTSFVPVGAAQAQLPADTVSVAVGEHVVMVEPIAVPLPAIAYHGAAAAETDWPGAEAALGAGTTYLVVSLRQAAIGHGPAVKGALAVTMVLCALSSFGFSIGAVWSPGATVANRVRLARIAEMLDGGELPALFWVGVRLEAGVADNGREATTTAITSGLAAFIDREIEFLPAVIDRNALAILLRFLCATIVREGHVLLDRETYVLSDTETLRVTFATNAVGRAIRVIKLLYVREVPPAREAAPGKPATARRPVFGRRSGQAQGR
jgi:hypothetical protein